MNKKSKVAKEIDFEIPKDDRLDEKNNNKLSVKKNKLNFHKLSPSYFGGQKIEIIDTPKIKNNFPIPHGHCMSTITGCSRSGKTYILLSLIPLFTDLKYLIIASKIIGNPVYRGLESYCNDENINYYFTHDPLELREIIENIVGNKSVKEQALIIYDDFNPSCGYSRTEEHSSVMIQSYQMLRNYNFNIITITQSYTGLPTLVRNNTNLLILFKMMQKQAIDKAALDWTNMTNNTKEDFYQIYKEVLSENHAYMLTNDVGETYLYKKSLGERLNKISFNDDDESESEKQQEN